MEKNTAKKENRECLVLDVCAILNRMVKKENLAQRLEVVAKEPGIYVEKIAPARARG